MHIKYRRPHFGNGRTRASDYRFNTHICKIVTPGTLPPLIDLVHGRKVRHVDAARGPLVCPIAAALSPLARPSRDARSPRLS